MKVIRDDLERQNQVTPPTSPVQNKYLAHTSAVLAQASDDLFGIGAVRLLSLCSVLFCGPAPWARRPVFASALLCPVVPVLSRARAPLLLCNSLQPRRRS